MWSLILWKLLNMFKINIDRILLIIILLCVITRVEERFRNNEITSTVSHFLGHPVQIGYFTSFNNTIHANKPKITKDSLNSIRIQRTFKDTKEVFAWIEGAFRERKRAVNKAIRSCYKGLFSCFPLLARRFDLSETFFNP